MVTVKKSEIQKWIDALRSGKYAQGCYQLQTKDGYCCLGVACEEFIPRDEQVLDHGRLDGGLPSYSIQPGAPEWLTQIDQDFYFYTGTHLTDLNDHLALTFDEIADLLQAVYIEKAVRPIRNPSLKVVEG